MLGYTVLHSGVRGQLMILAIEYWLWVVVVVEEVVVERVKCGC